MFVFIENLRNKSEGERKAFAYITSFVVTGIIFLIWISTFIFDVSAPNVTVPKINFDIFAKVFDVFEW